MRIRRPLAHAGRAVLLLCTLAAAATALVWQRRPDLVVHLERQLMWNYARPWVDWHKSVVRDPGETIERLEPLAVTLRPYRKHDRLFATRRNVLRVLTQTLMAEEDWERARAWTAEWVEADDRDLNAQVQLLDILLHEAATRAEGLARARDLHLRLPEVANITRTHLTALLEEGRPEEALEAGLRYLAAKPTPLDAMDQAQDRWKLFWHTGGGFVGSQRERFESVLHDGVFALSRQLEPGVQRLRLDPPLGSFYTVRGPRVLFDDGGGEPISADLFDMASELRNCTRRGAVLEVDGRSPAWIILDVPEQLRAKSFEFLLQGEVDCFPDWLTRLAELPEVLTLERRLSAQEDARGLEGLRVLRSHALAKSFVSLGWSGAGEAGDGAPSPDGGRVQGPFWGSPPDPMYFDLRLPVGPDARRLRLDLPPVLGAVFTIHRVELTVDGEALAVDTAAMRAQGARRSEQGFAVTAGGAHLTLPLPAGLGVVAAARVRGVAR